MTGVSLAMVVVMTLVSAIAVERMQDCYPGLACEGRGASGRERARVNGRFRFTHDTVVDVSEKHLWARNIYALGDSTELFREAFNGNRSAAATYDEVESKASRLKIAGLTGWRLAKATDLDGLFLAMESTSIYAYFRPPLAKAGSDSVIGIVKPQSSVGSVEVDGVIYDNVYRGRARRGLGGPDKNAYGVWLVRSLSASELVAAVARSEAFVEAVEPVTEIALDPVEAVQVTRSDGEVVLGRASEVASVSVRNGKDSRLVTRYNFGTLPPGELVSLEVVMRGGSGSGEPLTTVSLFARQGSAESKAAEGLWSVEGSTKVGVWQMTSSAKLEVPRHIGQNAFNSRESLVLTFTANFNECSFEVPQLVVRYVAQAQVLRRRQFPM